MIPIIIIDATLLVFLVGMLCCWLVFTKIAYHNEAVKVIQLRNKEMVHEKDRILKEIIDEKELLRLLVVTAIRNLELICMVHRPDDLRKETNLDTIMNRLNNAEEVLGLKI